MSRELGVAVKWIEDRTEHLTGSSSAGDRAGVVSGAFAADGELIGLRYKNICNMGAYLRAPEPASVYRMQSTANGCYGVKNIAVDNLLVVTNQVPIGLNRGYGGPQFYFALERMMDRAAARLGMDPLALRDRNFVQAEEFPYACPGGSILDAGNFGAALTELRRIANYGGLLEVQATAREEGRWFGIGVACGVEPSGSNMAYVTLAQTAEDRAKGRTEIRGERQRHRRHGSHRRRHGAALFHTQWPRARDRCGPTGRRIVGHFAGRCGRHHRDRHPDQPVVDSVGELRESIRGLRDERRGAVRRPCCGHIKSDGRGSIGVRPRRY